MSDQNYTEEFKEKALSLVRSSDNPISQTAKELGFQEPTLLFAGESDWSQLKSLWVKPGTIDH